MEKIIVIDTETTNDIDCPLVYDVGFIVMDITGKIYNSYSFMVADIFLDDFLMESAYFKEKIPNYWEDIRKGERELHKFSTIKKIFCQVCKENNIKKIVAHNCQFDYRALQNTQRFLTSSKYRWFFPFGVEMWCTLKMSKEIFGNNDQYGEFCYNNEYLTKKGQRRYTAEILYRFLINDNDFVESHTGLEDVLIEKEIFLYCIDKKKDINGKLWND
jgi:DNA polymerase III epsilon subunit-like protein